MLCASELHPPAEAGCAPLQFLTEVAVFVLLYGTLVNAWVQQGQTMATVGQCHIECLGTGHTLRYLMSTLQLTSCLACQGVEYINPNIHETAPWLVNGNGRVLMLFTMVALIPAIFMNKMSSVGTHASCRIDDDHGL